ncbi:hypothetical protein UPYG_G00270940 [Umbra pygmaea]|uniref:FYVE, RhoGEF and PH domain-containing protein 6 n=1 Tax=Umbra pygmaea TaxID=75934 RepID=A0ABD0WB30_UMBPY
MKPALAPKPCLSAKPLNKSTGRLHQTQDGQTPSEMSRSTGLLNTRNGIHRQLENNKPDWDYIIPICVCSQKNCLCLGNGNGTDIVMGKDQKTLHTHGKTEECKIPRLRESREAKRCQPVHNDQKNLLRSLPDVCAQAVELSANYNLVNTKPQKAIPVCHKQTQVDGDIFTLSNVIEQGGQGERAGSTGICKGINKTNHRPAVHPKPLLVPGPQKPRMSSLIGQEGPEQGMARVEAREEIETTVGKVKEQLERKSHPSPSVSAETAHTTDVPAGEVKPSDSWEHLPSSRTPCPPPALASPPREKAKMERGASSSQHLPSACPPYLPQDVEQEEMDSVDVGVYDELELSVDKEEGELEEEIYCNPTCHRLSTSLPNQMLLFPSSPVTVANRRSSEDNGDEQDKVSIIPSKPQRHSSPVLSLLKKELSEDGRRGRENTFSDDDKGRELIKDIQDGRSPKTKAKPELPANPRKKVERRSHIPQTSLLSGSTDYSETIGSSSSLSLSKPSRFSLGKKKAKSFSAADLTPSEVQKRSSFQKFLDLKLSVKMLPKLRAKGGQSSNSRLAETEQCVDRDPLDHSTVSGARFFSCPQLGREQSVDGDEFFPGRAEHPGKLDYENVSYYEEIPEYINLPLGLERQGGEASVDGKPSDWNDHLHGDDENIYEEQEPYHPVEIYNQLQTQQHSERSSMDEDIGQMVDVPSDEDIMVHSSDEDDDSSSSSKGETEPCEQSEADCAAKKSKIVHIVREIRSSEDVFVNVLKLLHIDFREAVSKASLQSVKPVVEERILNQILYYLPQLYELNQDLLRELNERVDQWDQHGRLADIFVKKGPYLKMYSTYIREFDKNVALLHEQTRKNQGFAAVVREFEARPLCANLALNHYLLKPVQRIPQYQLLLTDYLNNLSPDCEDYKDTQAALNIVKEVANHANDSMKQGDNFQKLIRVQCSLNGHHEIVVPGRVFLKEGVLKKLSRKVMQPRMFFLFNDTLLYTTPVQSGQFKLNNMMSLAGMKVSKPSQEAYQNELTIEGVERSFILSASSAAERDDWLEAISMAIKDHTRKKISFIPSKSLEEIEPEGDGIGASLGSKPPIWIPDTRTTMCMSCTCEFSITWRRHHCRACGKVVCQSCSSNKQPLEYLKNQPARVCDQCCVALQKQTSDLTPSPVLSPGGKPSFGFTRKTKRIPAALKEVSANTDNSSMSGYLQRSKGNKKQGKRLWFVIKNKVLYTYAASEDVAALESQPLLGFVLQEENEGPAAEKQQFKLYHKNTLYYIFKADDSHTAQRWIDAFKEAMVL